MTKSFFITFILLYFAICHVMSEAKNINKKTYYVGEELEKSWTALSNFIKGNIPNKPNASITLTIKPDPYETSDPTTQVKVTLRSDLFGNSSDSILCYAILITQQRYSQPPENGTWNLTNGWPPLPNWENDTVPYQVTPENWKPFQGAPGKGQIKFATYILGDGSFQGTRYWNKPLEENTKYALKIRAFTQSGFQDTDVLCFHTLENLPVAEIASLLISILIVTSFGVICSIFDFEWIRKMNISCGKKSNDNFSPVPEALSHKNFLKYVEDLLNNQGRLGNEFHLLGTLSSDVSTLCLHAQRIDNKQKNRYGNILPFDMTRVKLSVVDDDPSSDYINASFIKGYSEEVEYIACQGPLEETCYDFYRMILEQNIEVIVMLTDLMENGKEKCYKYYPSEEKVMHIRDFTIICCEFFEFHFYKKRIIEIRKGSKKVTVTQFQYKQWQDFACPDSVDDMLKFCDIIDKSRYKGCLLVHCSAGSGRTGTFIAIDVLLQRVKNNNKINVFNTILKLRQQRVGMVQTEVQLRYIYKCISCAIENSLTKTKETV